MVFTRRAGPLLLTAFYLPMLFIRRSHWLRAKFESCTIGIDL